MEERTPTVAIVDDDHGIRLWLNRILRQAGFEVACFASAEQFLESCDPVTPLGCVLLDVGLPGMSGLDLQARMNREGWPSPVVIMTAQADPRIAAQALEAGAVAFLEKPVEPALLLARVARAVAVDAEARVG